MNRREHPTENQSGGKAAHGGTQIEKRGALPRSLPLPHFLQERATEGFGLGGLLVPDAGPGLELHREPEREQLSAERRAPSIPGRRAGWTSGATILFATTDREENVICRGVDPVVTVQFRPGSSRMRGDGGNPLGPKA